MEVAAVAMSRSRGSRGAPPAGTPSRPRKVLREVPTSKNEDPLLSRGSFLVLSTITVGAAAVVVTIGTSAPLITRYFAETPSQVGPSFYNRVNLPIALLVAALLAMVPYLTWRGNAPREVLRRMEGEQSRSVALLDRLASIKLAFARHLDPALGR